MSVHKKTPARGRRTRLPKAERRERILEAALTAFERGGYHGTHVDDVIREADIARGTFYLYFPGKHEVFEALIDRMLGIFLEARPTTPEPEVASVAEAEAVLRASYHAVFETLRRHRRLCRLLFEEAVGLEQGFSERLARHYRAWHERVRATLTMFVDHGIARPALDTELTAEMVLGMVERLSRRYLFADRAPDLDRIVDAVVAMELRGILP
jgi:AcrR family transcriptional regulator